MSWSLREVNQPEGCGSGKLLQSHAFDQPDKCYRVGRSAGADITLPRSYMANSRKHAVVSLSSQSDGASQLMFNYVGLSEHVIQLNEAFLTRHSSSILEHGDEIRFRVRESTGRIGPDQYVLIVEYRPVPGMMNGSVIVVPN